MLRGMTDLLLFRISGVFAAFSESAFGNFDDRGKYPPVRLASGRQGQVAGRSSEEYGGSGSEVRGDDDIRPFAGASAEVRIAGLDA
jgi:hypothetical protein